MNAGRVHTEPDHVSIMSPDNPLHATAKDAVWQVGITMLEQFSGLKGLDVDYYLQALAIADSDEDRHRLRNALKTVLTSNSRFNDEELEFIDMIFSHMLVVDPVRRSSARQCLIAMGMR